MNLIRITFLIHFLKMEDIRENFKFSIFTRDKISINLWIWGFPHSSVGKESTCNARDPSSIPGSGRSSAEGIDYPLQYSWASLVAHLVRNPPAMWETWVWSLGWEDPKEEGNTNDSSILAWRIAWIVMYGIVIYSPWGHKESDTTEWPSLSLLFGYYQRKKSIN